MSPDSDHIGVRGTSEDCFFHGERRSGFERI
jgi:hypothetical protein